MIATTHLPETIASRYRPIRLIATGGMGTVYEVEHTLTGERLALKVLPTSANTSPEGFARFKHEVRASARIKSENVVRVTDADVAPELGGAPFLVMELLEGTDLERAAASAPPPTPAVVVDWLRQVAQAIDKAHRLGIVHRDLKPANLFLTTRSDGSSLVKILDFGIVKMIEEGTGATGTGQVLGTPKYMAPEQASPNAPVTPATDGYALGLIAYRLLIGESYYQGGIMVILGQLLHGQLQPPSERGSRFGAAFDAWFLKACHRDPCQRFASAAEQIDELAAALGLPAVPWQLPRERHSRRGGWRPDANLSRRAMLAAVAVAAVLVGGAVVGPKVLKVRRGKQLVCGLRDLTATTACESCMAQACCQRSQECGETAGCQQVDSCVRGCASGDAVCRGRCYAGRAAVAKLQQSVEACRATSCAAACLPAPWACLGKVRWDLPDRILQSAVVRTVAVCGHCGVGGPAVAGGTGGSPIPAASVRVCSLADPTCLWPLAAGTTDDGGGVILNIDTSLYKPPLAVFVEYRKAGLEDTLLPLNLPPLSFDLDVGHVELLDEKSNQESAATMLGTKYDPARATMDVYPRDCNGQLATQKVALTWLDRDDVTVTRGFIAYTGGAFAMNVPVNAAGVTRIVARLAETNQLIATANVVVRPRAHTEVHMVPAP